jgi:zinc transport system ATP-binding protein
MPPRAATDIPTPAPADVVLEVAGLTVAFDGSPVLADIGFRVPRGTVLAVIGPNGAGKTVLFRALIGALRFTGSVRWAPGTRIGYVPQKLDLERDVPMTGLDFLRARAALAGAGEDAIHGTLALVEVPPQVAAQPLRTLSGGQFQRLMVAFALVGRPNVLLLDEATAGVDEPGQERLYALVHRLQERDGLTVLLISHELSVVYRYATTVLCLGRRRAWLGPPRTLLTPELLREAYGAPLDYHVHDA